MERYGADAQMYVEAGADLKITSAIQNTKMDEDAALGLALFICLVLCGLGIICTAYRNTELPTQYNTLADTV